MTPLTTLLVAFLSWLLGLLTPQIVDAVRRRYDRTRIASALTSELGEAAERLAVFAYYVWAQHGELTVSRLEWAAGILERAEYHPRHRRIAKGLRRIIASGPDYLQALNHRNASDHFGNSRRIAVRRVTAPYLTTMLARLDVFPAGTRQALLGIDAQFRLLNEMVDGCLELGRSTFNPSIVDENRKILMANLKHAERAIGERAEFIVILIQNLDLNTELAKPAEILDDEPPTIDEVLDPLPTKDSLR